MKAEKQRGKTQLEDVDSQRFMLQELRDEARDKEELVDQLNRQLSAKSDEE